jgi:hypothetical protein
VGRAPPPGAAGGGGGAPPPAAGDPSMGSADAFPGRPQGGATLPARPTPWGAP